MKTNKPKILSVRIEHVTDTSPDTSYIGEYTKDISSGEYTFDRQEGVMRDGETIVAENVWSCYSRNEYRYLSGFQHYSQSGWAHVSDNQVNLAFLNCRYRANKAHTKGSRGNLFEKYKVIGWQNATTRAQKINCLNIVYCCEDAYRMETLQRGDWYYIGVIAKAEIQLSETSPIQTLRSGGLWGIESDCGDYYKEVEKEQLSELRIELEAIGFSVRAITRAFQQSETVNK